MSGINLELNPVQKVQDAKFTYGTIDVLDMGLVPADQIPDTADQDEPSPSASVLVLWEARPPSSM